MMAIWILLGFVVLVVLYLVGVYNSFVREAVEIDEAWSQIDVQLKRRTDLIPNLVETVKGYAKHEKDVFSDVTKARSAMMGATTPKAMAAADNMLSSALKSLFAVAEAYPQLKANENFMQLQKEVSDTEDKIAYSRQYYNTQVMDYNMKTKMFPGSVLAGMMNFGTKEYFKTDEAERKPVAVKF